jgi:hypothetical protein
VIPEPQQNHQKLKQKQFAVPTKQEKKLPTEDCQLPTEFSSIANYSFFTQHSALSTIFPLSTFFPRTIKDCQLFFLP